MSNSTRRNNNSNNSGNRNNGKQHFQQRDNSNSAGQNKGNYNSPVQTNAKSEPRQSTPNSRGNSASKFVSLKYQRGVPLDTTATFTTVEKSDPSKIETEPILIVELLDGGGFTLREVIRERHCTDSVKPIQANGLIVNGFTFNGDSEGNIRALSNAISTLADHNVPVDIDAIMLPHSPVYHAVSQFQVNSDIPQENNGTSCGGIYSSTRKKLAFLLPLKQSTSVGYEGLSNLFSLQSTRDVAYNPETKQYSKLFFNLKVSPTKLQFHPNMVAGNDKTQVEVTPMFSLLLLIFPLHTFLENYFPTIMADINTIIWKSLDAEDYEHYCNSHYFACNDIHFEQQTVTNVRPQGLGLHYCLDSTSAKSQRIKDQILQILLDHDCVNHVFVKVGGIPVVVVGKVGRPPLF